MAREQELLARALPRWGRRRHIDRGAGGIRCASVPGAGSVTSSRSTPTREKVGVLMLRAPRRGAIGSQVGWTIFPRIEFDVVLYRLVLHHLVYQGPLRTML